MYIYISREREREKQFCPFLFTWNCNPFFGNKKRDNFLYNNNLINTSGQREPTVTWHTDCMSLNCVPVNSCMSCVYIYDSTPIFLYYCVYIYDSYISFFSLLGKKYLSTSAHLWAGEGPWVSKWICGPDERSGVWFLLDKSVWYGASTSKPE